MDEQLTVNTFDQKPIGKTNQFMIDQYPPDFDPNAIFNQTKPEPLPIGKRIISKVLKIKKEALQQLLNNFNQRPDQFKQHEANIVKVLADANLQCQGLALKIICKFLQNNSQYPGETKALLKSVVQKIMVLQKQDLLSLGHQIVFWMMDHRLQELVLNQLNEYMLNKNPKIVAASLLLIKTLLQNYGHKRLKSMEPFYKNFTLLANNVRPVAKLQSVQLFKQVFKWMGENAFDLNMHVQVKSQIAKWSKQYLRQPMHIKRGLAKGEAHKKMINPMQQEQEDDTPIDILTHFDSRWVDKVLQIGLWKQKKKQLDQFIKKTKASNIIPRQTSHYITLIKRLMNQNNINLLQCGFKIIKNLCKGLKKHFNNPAKVCLPYVYQKLKDSKNMIIQECLQTLKIMLFAVSVQQMFQQVKIGLNDKSPIMRLHTLKFSKVLIERKDQRTVGVLKHLIDYLVKMNNDGSNQIRDLSLECLCKIKEHHGTKLFGDKLKSLPQKKINQIQTTLGIQENFQKMEEDQEPIINPYKPKPVTTNSKIKPTIKTASSIPLPSKNNIQSKHSNKDVCSNSQLEYQDNQETVKLTKPGSLTLINTSNVQSIFASPVMIPIGLLPDLSNLKEQVRQVAYEKINAIKNLTVDCIWSLKNRCIKESSPTILKLIINILKKIFNLNYVNLETVQFLNFHDWKKCKGFLIQFLTGHNLTQEASLFVKAQGLLKQSGQKNVNFNTSSLNSISQNNSSNQSLSTSIKLFFNAIANNISRLSNPLVQNKIAAARQLIGFLQNVQKLQESDFTQANNYNVDLMTQFYNIIKFRLIQRDENVYKEYANFTLELIRKGVIDGKRGAIIIFPSLLQRLAEQKQIFLPIIRELTISSPKYSYQYFCVQICRQNLTPILIPFLFETNDLFIAHADHRSFVQSLLVLIGKQGLDFSIKQKCQMILDQVVQLNGEIILQNVAKQSDLKGIQGYLKKWNINVETRRPSTMELKSNLMSKSYRLTSLANWPLQPSQSHIRQLIQVFQTLGRPFSVLNSTFRLSADKFLLLQNLDEKIIQENTDLFIQWVFWRVFVEYPADLQKIFRFLQRIIDSCWIVLADTQLIIVLGIISNCLQYNIGTKEFIFQIHRKFIQKSQNLEEQSFTFWSNHLVQSSSQYIDRILQLIRESYVYKELSGQELTSLARIPQASKNQLFRQYLQKNYNKKMLPIFGFKFDQAKDNQRGNNSFLLSKGEFQFACQMQPDQRTHYCDIFEKYSEECSQKISMLIQAYPAQKIMELHLKIIQSIALPFLNQQIPFLNVHNYIKTLQRTLTVLCLPSGENGQRVAPYLLHLTRNFIFMLVDLSQTKLQSKDQILKLVNKLNLILLDFMQARHIIEVLIVLLKYAYKEKLPLKVKTLITKSMTRVIRHNVNFRLDPFLNTRFFFDVIQKIFSQFDLSADLEVIKSFKLTFVELARHYSLAVFETVTQKAKQQSSHPELQIIYSQLMDFFSQNKMFSKSQPMEIQVPQNMNQNMSLNQNNTTNQICALKQKTQTMNNTVLEPQQKTQNQSIVQKALQAHKNYAENSLNRKNLFKSNTKVIVQSKNLYYENRDNKLLEGNCKEYQHQISKIKNMNKSFDKFNFLASQKKNLTYVNNATRQLNAEMKNQMCRIQQSQTENNINNNSDHKDTVIQSEAPKNPPELDI